MELAILVCQGITCIQPTHLYAIERRSCWHGEDWHIRAPESVSGDGNMEKPSSDMSRWSFAPPWGLQPPHTWKAPSSPRAPSPRSNAMKEADIGLRIFGPGPPLPSFPNDLTKGNMTSLMSQACERCWRRKQKVCCTHCPDFPTTPVHNGCAEDWSDARYSATAAGRYASSASWFRPHASSDGTAPSLTHLTLHRN